VPKRAVEEADEVREVGEVAQIAAVSDTMWKVAGPSPEPQATYISLKILR